MKETNELEIDKITKYDPNDREAEGNARAIIRRMLKDTEAQAERAIALADAIDHATDDTDELSHLFSWANETLSALTAREIPMEIYAGVRQDRNIEVECYNIHAEEDGNLPVPTYESLERAEKDAKSLAGAVLDPFDDTEYDVKNIVDSLRAMGHWTKYLCKRAEKHAIQANHRKGLQSYP